MLTNPKTSTEWGTYSFSHAPTTTSGSCPCTPLQALRLSKKNVLTDLYRMRNLPQIWQGVFSTKSGHPIPFFWCTFMIFRNTGPYRVGSLTWANIWAELLLGRKKTIKNTKIHFVEGWCERTLVSPSHLKTLKRTKKYFVEATPVPHFQFL